MAHDPRGDAERAAADQAEDAEDEDEGAAVRCDGLVWSDVVHVEGVYREATLGRLSGMADDATSVRSVDQRAERLRPFGATIFSEITGLARAHGAVNLGQGFPDEDGPAILKDAAARALREEHNQYAPLGGVPAFAEQIARRARLGRAVDPATEVTVTSGCTEAIAATMLGLVNPGDEVVLFQPFYDSYRACLAMAGATARYVTLRRDGGRFTFDPDELRALCGARTRAILVNSPHNPTGTVFSREELSVIAEVCRERDIVAVCDEVYEHLVYDGEHVSLASLPGMAERSVVCSSLGKTFAMTGWKIGWTVASPELTAAIRSAHQFLVFSVATPLQHAAAAALGSDEAWAWVEAMRERYRGNRDALSAALSGIGFDVCGAEAGYFVMAGTGPIAEKLGVQDGGWRDTDLCKRMIEEAGVACIPPSVFYADPDDGNGHGHLRFAFCKRREVLDEAIRRLRRWLGG